MIPSLFKLIYFLGSLIGLLFGVRKEICYPELGCYNLEGPWKTLSQFKAYLPEHPDIINTTFYLTTRRARQREAISTHPSICLDDSSFDGEKWTFFIIHGYLSNGILSWVRNLEAALLSLLDANVIIVNYERGAWKVHYGQAIANLRVVANETARLIKYLVQFKGASTKRIHLIGHSLGAQASSYIANEIGGVARITGLDPALPGFGSADVAVRLDASDADFVDVVHTSGNSHLRFGLFQPVGHVDFYVNDGKAQPGCFLNPSGQRSLMGDIVRTAVTRVSSMVGCSHERSISYFTEALQEYCNFWGHRKINGTVFTKKFSFIHSRDKLEPCQLDTCNILGMRTPEFPARGVFYVVTNPSSPFCVPEYDTDAIMKKSLRLYKRKMSRQ